MPIKIKIYATLALWLGITAAAFAYGFPAIDRSNRAVAANIAQEKSQMLDLETQEQSFLLAKRDLQDLAQQPIQPQDFFSQDVTLVKEIEELEALGKSENVHLTLGGISGTINSEPKAKTKSALYAVPYSITVNGSFADVVNYVQTLEHVDFVTALTSLSMAGSGGDNVTASMSATFYIRK